MTKDELARMASKLEASGVHFARMNMAGGNLRSLDDVPWDAAVVRIMAATGWRLVEDAPATVTPLRSAVSRGTRT